MKTVFVNGLVIDGAGSFLEGGGVLVEGERIMSVGKEIARQYSQVDRVIDLAGRSIMPGMIDTHCHPAEGDYDPSHENDSIGLASLRSVQSFHRTLLAGFTTVRSAGVRDFLDVDARDAVNEGAISGPRIVASGPPMRRATEGPGPIGPANVEEMRQAVRQNLKRGVDNIKIMATGSPGPEEDEAKFTVEEMRAAVEEARLAGKTTIAHAIGINGIRASIEAGVTSVDHGVFLDEEICEMMVAKEIWWVPTLAVWWYYATMRKAEQWRWQETLHLIEPHKISLRMAIEKGVSIAFGCDCGALSRFPNGENALEYRLLVEAGMKPMDAIVSGAINAARLLKLDHLIGSLEPGKLADLVVIDGNPLDDISRLQSSIAYVMREGRTYRDELAQ